MATRVSSAISAANAPHPGIDSVARVVRNYKHKNDRFRDDQHDLVSPLCQDGELK
jgi:hypothetical protein